MLHTIDFNIVLEHAAPEWLTKEVAQCSNGSTVDIQRYMMAQTEHQLCKEIVKDFLENLSVANETSGP